MPHSGRCLHKTWSQWLKSEGFDSVVGYEKSMWVKKEYNQQIMLCTHVDDSLVTTISETVLIKFQCQLEVVGLGRRSRTGYNVLMLNGGDV